MSNRDEDRTLIDIRFAHNVLDPAIMPESFASDLIDPNLVEELDYHDHIGLPNPNTRMSAPTGFIVGVLIISVLYLLWVWFLGLA